MVEILRRLPEAAIAASSRTDKPLLPDLENDRDNTVRNIDNTYFLTHQLFRAKGRHGWMRIIEGYLSYPPPICVMITRVPLVQSRCETRATVRT